MNSWFNRSPEYSFRGRWLGQSRRAVVEVSVTVDGEPVEVGAGWGGLSRSNSAIVEFYEQ